MTGTRSAKTSADVPGTGRGTDAAKKTVGRKRGLLTDTIGPILAATAAGPPENAPGLRLLGRARETYPTLPKSGGDTGFKNAGVEPGARLGINVEGVDRNPRTRGSQVAERRRGVERSIGWSMMHRRLARACEILTAGSGAMIRIAPVGNLARRMTDETTPTRRGTHRDTNGNLPTSNAL